MQIIIRSGDTKKFVEEIKKLGSFEYVQWGSMIKFEYMEGAEYPVKLVIDGVQQPDKKIRDLYTFIFTNRRSINTQIRKLQGKQYFQGNKYLHLDRVKFEELYKDSYKKFMLMPTPSCSGYFQGVDAVATKLISSNDLETLRSQALREIQILKDIKKNGVNENSNN